MEKELQQEIVGKAKSQALKQTAIAAGKFPLKIGSTVAMELAPKSRAGLSSMQSAPQTILSKEQRMLNAMFNSKNQFWGNGDVVRINRTLTSGQGLIKTGDGDSTRRLFLP